MPKTDPQTATVHAHIMEEWIHELGHIENTTSYEDKYKARVEFLTKIYALGTDDGERFAYAKREI